ncbi:GNAT family N-acetyltransferase [Chloroflexota bacterium]
MLIIRNILPDDIIAYVKILGEIDNVDRLGAVASVEYVAECLGQPGCYPGEDLFFAELDGVLVGYASMVRELEIGRVIVSGAVHPAYRGRGVGSQLLEAALSQGYKLEADAVHIPVDYRLLAGEHFVRKKGFRIVCRQWQMNITGYRSGEVNVPDGFDMGHFVAGDEESLCNLQNLAFAGSWGFRPNSVEEVRYLVSTSCCHPEGILFLNEGKNKVGYCWTMDHPTEKGRGCIHMMGVHPMYRERGLGRLVLVAALEYFKQRGIKEIELVVDSKNRQASHLYRSLGFKRKGRTLWYQRRLAFD